MKPTQLRQNCHIISNDSSGQGAAPSQKRNLVLCSLQELSCPHRSLRVPLMLSHFTTESCLAHGGVTTGCPCQLSATQADLQSSPSSAPAPARPLLLGIPAGILVLGALLPPRELWLFLGCCSSSFSGIFASDAALEEQGENNSRICLGAPVGMRSLRAACVLMCCKREPPKPPANPLAFVRKCREQELLVEHLPPLLHGGFSKCS